MQRARILKVEYREPFQVRLKGFIKNRGVIASLIFIVIGAGMFSASFHFQDIILTPNHSYANMTASQNASSFSFVQPYNVTESIYFQMPSNQSAHFVLLSYFNYVNVRDQRIITFKPVDSGNITNHSIVHMKRQVQVQGQEYYLNVTSGSNSSFNVFVNASYYEVLKEPTSRYVGGAGIILILGGVVSLAYMITRIKSTEKKGRNR